MSYRIKLLTVACLGLFGLLVGLKLASSPLFAVEGSSWLSGDPAFQLEESVTGPEAQESFPAAIDGGNCWEYEFNQKSTVGNKIYYPKTKLGCAVDTAYGVAAGNYFHEYGEEYAGQFYKSGSNVYYPIPNSGTLVAVSGTSRNNLRLYPNFATFAETANINGHEMTYILKNNFITVADGSGNPIQVSSSPPSSSKNGQWVTSYLKNLYSVRVNLNSANGEPLLFGGVASGPLRQTISNDGRFVAVFYLSSKKTVIYDLSTCKTASSIAQGCEYIDITTFLNQNLGNVQNILRLEFIDENHLVLYALHNSASGIITRSKIQLTPGDGQMLKLDGGYIALGDSFASGEGDLDDSYYEVGTNEPENKCHLSRRSYPYLISQSLGITDFHSVACSGATTDHLISIRQSDDQDISYPLGDWLPGIDRQVDYLIDIPDTITLSIGGNNVGFASKLKECALWGGTCKYAEAGADRAGVAKEIASLSRTLKNTYENIINRTQQKTKLFVIGYPQFIKPDGGNCGLNVRLNDSERRFIFEAVKYMNQVIKAAANNAGAYYVDIEDALINKNLCSQATDSTMAVNGLTFGDDKELPWWAGLSVGGLPGLIAVENIGIGNESFHPNQNGHYLMSNAILSQTAGNPLSFPVCDEDLLAIVCPSGSSNVPTPDETYWGSEAFVFASGINLDNNVTINQTPTFKPMVVVDSTNHTQPKVVVEHLKPGSIATLEIHSSPTDLGQFTVDENGKLDTFIDIPESIQPGFHTLRLFGTNTTGEPVEFYEHVYIPGLAGDVDSNGIPDEQQACGFVEDSGIDNDQDGVDDSCDPIISDAPLTSPELDNHQVDLTDINTQLLSQSSSEDYGSIEVIHNTDSHSGTNNINDSTQSEVRVAGISKVNNEQLVDNSNQDNLSDKNNDISIPIAVFITISTTSVIIYMVRRYSIN